MTCFHELFRQPTQPVGGIFPPDRRRELFPAVVGRCRNLRLWSPGGPDTAAGPRLLIGVAVWSGYDMDLLDRIEAAPASPLRIDVFDADLRGSVESLRQVLPAVELGHQPPFVGHWVDGRLIGQAFGHGGRELVYRLCGIE